MCLAQRAGLGPRVSDGIGGGLWRACKHHGVQRGAVGQAQGAPATEAPEVADEERPEQQPESN
jgi:hypothetical protein